MPVTRVKYIVVLRNVMNDCIQLSANTLFTQVFICSNMLTFNNSKWSKKVSKKRVVKIIINL